MDLFILLKSAGQPSGQDDGQTTGLAEPAATVTDTGQTANAGAAPSTTTTSSVDVTGPKPAVRLSGTPGVPSPATGIPSYDDKYGVMYWSRGGSSGSGFSGGGDTAASNVDRLPTREDYTAAIRRYRDENLAAKRMAQTPTPPAAYRDYVSEAIGSMSHEEPAPVAQPQPYQHMYPGTNPEDVFDMSYPVRDIQDGQKY